MKINRTKLQAAALMIVAVTLGAVRGSAETLIANVPFNFRLDKMQLPPGEYTVSKVSNDGIPVLLIRNWQAGKSALIVAHNVMDRSKDTRPRMVFECLEDNCALSEIWGATAAGGVSVTPHRSERFNHAAFVYLKTQKNAH